VIKFRIVAIDTYQEVVMRRYMWPWLVAAVVPAACGANIDVGGPRSEATAGSGASSDGDTGTASSSAIPHGDTGTKAGGSGGTSGATDPIEAGAGMTVGSADAGGAGTTTDGGSGSTVPPHGYSGPFKLLVLSKAVGFYHESIPACQALLATLGQTPDEMMPEGAAPGSQFTVDIANDDLSDFTDDKLKDYGMLFWCNPTGDVFSTGGANGKVGMAAIQKFVEGGGAWGGVHSATDFERNGFPWFTDTLVGASMQSHDANGTAGIVQTEADFVDHPVVRGVPPMWSTQDEWYTMTRDIRALPGFQVLASLAADQRPVVWTKELGDDGMGRMFYTVRGHSPSVYQEPDFKKLVLNGILWATHRLD
jgi:type 1 glutamine amidotransferase